ncbi:hypothetical protein KEM55_006921 [Ascosphaera atra]|nr:hypothetical protein KEM55_006921 [Ascosphaera atra]
MPSEGQQEQEQQKQSTPSQPLAAGRQHTPGDIIRASLALPSPLHHPLLSNQHHLVFRGSPGLPMAPAHFALFDTGLAWLALRH